MSKKNSMVIRHTAMGSTVHATGMDAPHEFNPESRKDVAQVAQVACQILNIDPYSVPAAVGK